MSQISLKSISGITSITTPAGVDNQFTIHTNNTTEAFKLDHAGNLHFHNHLSITGVSTASNFKTGTSNLHNTGLNIQDLDVDGHTNLDNVSVAGVSTFTGNVIVDNGTVRCNDGFSSDVDLILNADANNNGTGSIIFKESGSEKFRVGYSGQLGIGGPNYGTSGQVLTSGGSGSAVTWSTISGTTINNNSDDRLITGTGTANTINAEADLTFDGTNLKLTDHKNMYFGTGNDLRIWHDANNSYSQIAGSQKNLYIDGLTTYMRSGNGSGSQENAIVMNNNGSVDLYHSGTKMCETSTNGLAFPSGKGIDFSDDSSGTLKTLANSFNAEVLHDYEVGTFTPNIQYDTGTNQYYGSPGSGHYVASSKGEYIRIGDMVWAAGEITLTGNRNSTQTVHISIGGMPYNGLHSSEQNSLMSGWGGAAWPKNDSNASYRLIYSYHNYTTLNFYFKQNSGNNGIDGFRFHVYYRCPT